MNRIALAAVGLAWVGLVPTLRGDVFSYRDERGQSQEVEARLAGTGEGSLLLELDDGQYRMIPEAAIVRREPKDGPAPLDDNALAARLQSQFGAELFRSYVKEPYVMGLVLAAPLPKANESRVRNFLQRVANFMRNVDTSFVAFVKEARLTVQPPSHPLPVLIFETDSDFEKYAREATQGQGLAAGRIAGFYSKLTNVLAIRLQECRTFDVPLHEAIHQQVYNRHVFQRLAPIPHWFDEGIATGFESSEGKVGLLPTKINPRYARQVLAARNVTFDSILADDRAFGGDVLVDEAYSRAWSLHWLLLTRYRTQYARYVRLLAAKEPLAPDSAEQRLADFRQAFGKEVDGVDSEFNPLLEMSVKRQKVQLNPPKPVGVSQTQEKLGEVELSAVNRLDTGAGLEVQGKLTNLSPVRALAFHVTVETDGGAYAEWHVPTLEVQRSTPLALQYVDKRMRGGRGGQSRTFRVRIRSALPGSGEAEAWKSGQLPVPQAD